MRRPIGPSQNLWDRMPRWLQIATVIGGVLWFAPPMVLVLLRMMGAI